MYRFLLTWRWFGALVLALAVAAGCVVLGQWQWDRRAERLERNGLVTTNYGKAPSPLDEVLAHPRQPLPRGTEWTPVSLHGRYLPEQSLLLRNRPLDGRPGHHVLVPFQVENGPVLLVDRGWLPTGQTGSGPDDVPPPPAGDVQVVVRLRPAEPPTDRGAPPGQVQRISPATMPLGGTVGGEVVTRAYGVLASEAPAPQAAPVPLPRPEIDEGPHLSYSLQWFVFAVGALVALVVLVRRTAADDDAAPRPVVTRRRPTAEDEEDALVDAQLLRNRHPVGQDEGHGPRPS